MRCIAGSWDLIIPSELLQEILSRLVLKDNLHASLVCKTWCEASVSVRKLQPWLLYPALEESSGTCSHYILFDPLGFQTHQQRFPELKDHELCYSRDGWLVVRNGYPSVFFLNPFTRERINLPWGWSPEFSSYYCLAFSAAPTSSSCVVISLKQIWCHDYLFIHTWLPGETVWTPHRFENQLRPQRKWTQCVFSNGMFYWLSACGYLGVFDPSRATWNVLQVKPCPANFVRPMLMTEHEGNIFVMYKCGRSYQPVFKLNLERKVWEEKRELGGLTVFSSYSTPLTRAGPSAEEKNMLYERLGSSYYLANDKSLFVPLGVHVGFRRIALVDPPQLVKL
ncbi:unnamed protein product [Arabis nemorensis]|uniref:Uncharacterized protein n=1 Tax=Arabis nemorensis TaxID=586526 RepID=A0A565BE88_9BRAS|nr:unnamed protein product [Arabis nemorensis]